MKRGGGGRQAIQNGRPPPMRESRRRFDSCSTRLGAARAWSRPWDIGLLERARLPEQGFRSVRGIGERQPARPPPSHRGRRATQPLQQSLRATRYPPLPTTCPGSTFGEFLCYERIPDRSATRFLRVAAHCRVWNLWTYENWTSSSRFHLGFQIRIQAIRQLERSPLEHP